MQSKALRMAQHVRACAHVTVLFSWVPSAISTLLALNIKVVGHNCWVLEVYSLGI